MQPLRAGQGLRGQTGVPGDKSLSHRAILLGMLAQGRTEVRNWLAAGDTEATLGAARALGVPILRHDTNTLSIDGGCLREADGPLNFVNAGTGIRLAAGIMVGQSFPSVLDGSDQLRRRPMKRVAEPLQLMGANISTTDGRCPLHIRPAQLRGVHYVMSIASAQVKSAVLLAALFADSPTTVVQPGPARDHTELMLQAMGADLVVEGNTVTLTPGKPLQPLNLSVPGDFSSAAFLMVAASVVPDSEITLTGVNLNRTRDGLLDVLRAMGADIEVIERGVEGGEPVGTLRVRSAVLRGVEVGGDVVVRMIDEFPVLMVAALCAEGETLVRDAQELRVKETDRIAVMAAELRKMGAEIEERPDGYRIVGPQKLRGAEVDGHDDHRIAMTLSVAAMIAQSQTVVHDIACAADSFPGFPQTLQALGVEGEVRANGA